MENFYSRSITEYCERVGNEFYSEPFNALSNIAFFVSVFFIYKLFKNHAIKSFGYWFLFALLVLGGIGSLSWHSFRNPLTLFLDAVPIFIFFLTFVYLLLVRLTQSRSIALVLLVGFFMIQVLASYAFPTFLNGSIRHFVNGIAFLGIVVWLYKKYDNLNRHLLVAFLLYILAIIFRSIDNSVCSIIPVGTHFMWHILNATAAYFAIRGLISIDSSK